MNDEDYLHDTRSHGEDPCTKEFRRKRDAGELEEFSHEKHLGKFEVLPPTGRVISFKFSKYGSSVHAVLQVRDTKENFIAAIGKRNLKMPTMMDLYLGFCKHLHHYFKSRGEKFSIELNQHTDPDVISILQKVLTLILVAVLGFKVWHLKLLALRLMRWIYLRNCFPSSS